MKKLNEELAKLLGIEPKEQTNCGLCPYGEDLDESDICPHYMSDECDEIELIYPDFTSPYNFVSLIEIIQKQDCCHHDYIDIPPNTTFVNGYLKWTLDTIINEWHEQGKNELKQQAQQTDWSY